MAIKLVLSIVDGQDVLMLGSKLLEKKLCKRYSREDLELALMAAEDQLSEILKQTSKRSKVGVGGTD